MWAAALERFANEDADIVGIEMASDEACALIEREETPMAGGVGAIPDLAGMI
jgi:hypothetical protein